MSNLFQIGALDACGGLLPLVKVIRKGLFWILYLIMPIVLILLVTIDIAKAVIASDEKEVKAAQGRAIKRAIYSNYLFRCSSCNSCYELNFSRRNWKYWWMGSLLESSKIM